jgi:hypothetical protein
MNSGVFLSSIFLMNCCRLLIRFIAQNLVVKWFAVLLRIVDVPGSNLGLEAGCPD